MIIDTHRGQRFPADPEAIKLMLKQMQWWGIEKSIVWSLAREPAQMGPNNDYVNRLVKEHHGKIIPFASVYPHDPKNAVKELSRAIKQLGFAGLKIHPKRQEIKMNHPSVIEVVRAARDLDIPVVFHVDSPDVSNFRYNQEIIDHDTQYAKAKFLLDIIKEYNSPNLWAAHMGGATVPAIQKSRIVFQTCVARVPTIEEAVRSIGSDRIVFGSDHPWCDVIDEIAKVDHAQISDSDKEKIYYTNAVRLLKL